MLTAALAQDAACVGALLQVTGAERRFDCSKAKDPKACEERREKVRAARAKAAEACKGAAQGERRDCMRREMCAQSADPAKCEARAKERAERRQNRQKKQ